MRSLIFPILLARRCCWWWWWPDFVSLFSFFSAFNFLQYKKNTHTKAPGFNTRGAREVRARTQEARQQSMFFSLSFLFFIFNAFYLSLRLYDGRFLLFSLTLVSDCTIAPILSVSIAIAQQLPKRSATTRSISSSSSSESDQRSTLGTNTLGSIDSGGQLCWQFRAINYYPSSTGSCGPTQKCFLIDERIHRNTTAPQRQRAKWQTKLRPSSKRNSTFLYVFNSSTYTHTHRNTFAGVSDCVKTLSAVKLCAAWPNTPSGQNRKLSQQV